MSEPSSDPKNVETASRKTYLKELFQNQVWQSLNFVSKAGFLILLTPLMLKQWGPVGYGLFALSSSLLVSMALLDGGVTSLTRLRLATAKTEGDDETYRQVYSEGLLTFMTVVAGAMVIAIILALTGLMKSWLNLPDGGEYVLVLTVILTGMFMTSVLACQPIAAAGNLSLLKAANTWGAVAAIPVTVVLLFLNASVAVVVTAYTFSITIPNIVVAWRAGLFELRPWERFWSAGFRAVFRTLHSGMWFYLTTVALIVKTHALTFVVSAMAGPAEAGIFYVLLRLTEIVGNVGATASETSLAQLASARSDKERADCFHHCWLYVAVFCLHGAVALGCLGDRMIHLWLNGAEILPYGAGPALAIFGLSGAFSRVVVNAAMGLNIVRQAAIGNLAEAATSVTGAILGYHLGGLPGLFLVGSFGILFLFLPAKKLASLCGEGIAACYVKPLLGLFPGLAVALVLQGAARFSDLPLVWLGALGLSGVVALWQLRAIHRSH